MSTAGEKQLRTIEADGTLKEWSLERPKPPAQVAVVELPVRLVQKGSVISPVTQTPSSYRISTGGEWAAIPILTLGRFGKPDTVQVWNLAGTGSTTPTILEAPPRKGTPAPKGDPNARSPLASRTLFISDDGRRIAMSRFNSRSRPALASGKSDSEPLPPKSDVIVWDVPSKRVLRQFELTPGEGDFGMGGMSGFSADGTTIAITRRETDKALPDTRARSRTKLWAIDVETGREGPTIAIDGNVMPASATLSPDGKRYAGFIRIPAADGTWTDRFAVQWRHRQRQHFLAALRIEHADFSAVGQPTWDATPLEEAKGP